MKIQNQSISSKDIIINDEDHNVLGPELFLDKCHVKNLSASESLVLIGVTITNSYFEQIVPLVNFHFEGAHFKNTKFSGVFSGCDFGDWDSPERSSISECDFSNAELDGVRFINCDMQNIKLPSWPFFAITPSPEAIAFVKENDWPVRLGSTLKIYTGAECSAVIGNAKRLAQKNKLTLSQMKELITKIPGTTV